MAHLVAEAERTYPSLPPGPAHPRPVQAALWGLRYPTFTAAAHRRFGPTFTARPGTMDPVVVTTDRDAAKRLLTGDPLTRFHGNDAIRPLIDDQGLMLLEPAPHLERRKLLLPAFHGERVQGYAELMERLIEAELESVTGDRPLPLLPLAQDVTIEVILQAVLGVGDRRLAADFRRLIDAVLFYPFASLRLRIGRRIQTPSATPQKLSEVAAFLSSLPSPAVSTYYPELKTRSRWNLGTRRWWLHRDALVAMLDRQIETTIADPRLGERDDILAMLVQARDEDGNGLSREALINDLILLIGAGHETTAAAIAWAVVLLAHDPEALADATRAAQEGDDAYIAALVKEVLRIRPPIPVAAARRLAEPLEIGPHLIPARTMILIDSWGLHHDPGLYPDPEAFRPRRFLEGSPPPYGWLPFGGGAHRCIGSALAELEIAVALKRILSLRTIAPAGPALPPPARRGITIVPHGGGRVHLGVL